LLIDDGENSTAGVDRADLEVIEAATAPQGHGALAVGDVISEAEVAAAGGFRRPRLRCRPVCLTRSRPANRTVGPLLVVCETERVELHLELREACDHRPLAQVAFQGLVEPLDLALGLWVPW